MKFQCHPMHLRLLSAIEAPNIFEATTSSFPANEATQPSILPTGSGHTLFSTGSSFVASNSLANLKPANTTTTTKAAAAAPLDTLFSGSSADIASNVRRFIPYMYVCMYVCSQGMCPYKLFILKH